MRTSFAQRQDTIAAGSSRLGMVVAAIRTWFANSGVASSFFVRGGSLVASSWAVMRPDLAYATGMSRSLLRERGIQDQAQPADGGHRCLPDTKHGRHHSVVRFLATARS